MKKMLYFCYLVTYLMSITFLLYTGSMIPYYISTPSIFIEINEQIIFTGHTHFDVRDWYD